MPRRFSTAVNNPLWRASSASIHVLQTEDPVRRPRLKAPAASSGGGADQRLERCRARRQRGAGGEGVRPQALTGFSRTFEVQSQEGRATRVSRSRAEQDLPKSGARHEPRVGERR